MLDQKRRNEIILKALTSQFLRINTAMKRGDLKGLERIEAKRELADINTLIKTGIFNRKP